MSLPTLVRNVVGTYLGLVDAEAPGLVQGLYLEGSVALGAFRPGASDVDFVAVTREPPDMLDALDRVHARLRERQPAPCFDGVYLTWADLAAGPVGAAGRPAVLDGAFRPDGGAPSPVTWHTLARHGVTCRGPALAGVPVWADDAALAAWQDDNLDAYWGRLLAAVVADPAGRAGQFALTDDGCVWVVTGVARLHHTLGTGRITSKEGAARHALEAFGARWHRVLREALRLRRDEPGPSLYPDPESRRRDVLAFAETAIAEGHLRYARRQP